MKTAILFLTVLILLPLSSIGQRRGGGSKPTTPTVTINSTVTHGTCSNPNGSIDYTVNISTGWTRATKVNVLQLMDNTGHPVYTQEGIGATGSIQNITPGAYYYEGSITVQNSAGYYVSIYIHIPIWIGIQTEWAEMVEMTASPNSYSAKRSGTANAYGGARSANYLSSGDGWIEMSGVYGGTSDSRVYWLLGASSNVSSFDPNANVQYIEFYKTSSGNGIRLKYQTSGGTYSFQTLSTSPSDKIRLVRMGSSLKIQKNSSTSTVFTLPVAYSGGLNIGVYAKQPNDGVKDVISTFGCLTEKKSYSHLKRKLDGGYSKALNGIVRFTFDEEHSISGGQKVSVSVFSKTNELMEKIDFNGTSIHGTSPEIYNYDDTRYALDLSGVPGMTHDEFYVMEVTTSKEEKLYLRFIYKN